MGICTSIERKKIELIKSNEVNNSIKNNEENSLKTQSNNESEIKQNNSLNSKIEENPESNNRDQIDKITVNNVVAITPGIDIKYNGKIGSINHDINYGIFESVSKKDLEESQKKFGNSIENSFKNRNFSNYEEININENIYLICPDCNLFITKIESVDYSTEYQEFNFKYYCSCKGKKEYYLYLIIKGKKPICEEHNKEIKFFCEFCKDQLCEECKYNNHNEHQIKNIINCEVISEKIMEDISLKKNDFKGFDVFDKIFNLYKFSTIFIKSVREPGIKLRTQKKGNEKQEKNDSFNNFEGDKGDFNAKDKIKNYQENIDNMEISSFTELIIIPEQNINIKKNGEYNMPETFINNDKSNFNLLNEENQNYLNKENKEVKINVIDNYTEKIIKNNNSKIDILEKELQKEKNKENAVNNNDSKNNDENNNKNTMNKISHNNLIIKTINFSILSNKNQKKLNKYINTKTLIGHKNRVYSLIKLNSGYIATGSSDNTIKIWDITKDPNNALIATKNTTGNIFCLLELKDNELLSGNSDNNIEVFDLTKETDNSEYYLSGHSKGIRALVKCNEENFASASNDTKIFIWDCSTKRKIKELLGHVDCVLTMILLENGNLVSGSADNTIRIWDWKNGYCLSYFKVHEGLVLSICQFNNQILLSGSNDTKIRIWDENMDMIDELEGHKNSVKTLCKISDNYFASGSFDNKIKIWDIKERKCADTLEGHSSNVTYIIKYDDKLISCSCDHSIKIWEKI